MYPPSRPPITLLKATKAQYSETEAAETLGVSVDELRALVRNHIAAGEESGNGAVSVFLSSDLLVLRILTGRTGQTSAAR